ncbi:putative transmembrane 9 superfamily member 1-like, partial [Apostichopus japonicus]
MRKVHIYVNKVGPYYNPHETYHYYQLPVCRPETVETKSLTLGEILDGDRMAESMYDIKFKESTKEDKHLCTFKLTPEELSHLKEAIEDLYYFEFVVDDIPLRGFVGLFQEKSFFPHEHQVRLWTHHHFYLEYHGDQIIYANISVHNREGLLLSDSESGLQVQFTYNVTWKETDVDYAHRAMRLIKDPLFFPHTLEVHWLSVINSMVLVFLLIGFVLIILHKSLLSAILGVGSQFLALATAILLMAMTGMFNVHRHGSMNSAAVLIYALTSCIAGYVSSNFYKQLGGEKWVWNIVLTSCMFSVPFFVVWSFVNSVAWYQGSTQALPFTTILLLMLVWILVGYPLTIIGGIIGKNTAGNFDAPCRTKNICREIPPVPWYRSATMHCIIGGFLPFSAISVEMYYIFTTLWGREHYTLYGILFVVYGILLSVTACISVALSYFQLSNEDYRWWWRSIFSAGSTGFFVFLYSIFYFFKRSSMSGTLQTVQFFGYTILVCYIFFLMLGTVSFFASLKFIRYIYTYVKLA